MDSNLIYKAILLPLNPKGEIFIQDRRGYKKPDWGLFGGSMEAGESPVGAILREAQEELDLVLTEADLVCIGEVDVEVLGNKMHQYIFVYPTDTTNFTVLEGQGGEWATINTMRERFQLDTYVNDIEVLLKKYEF
jgi:8-oxo-dGTP pyrophosphatase MutT (NUDIX family)